MATSTAEKQPVGNDTEEETIDDSDRHLTIGDNVGIIICWAGAATIVWLTKGDIFITFISICASYYLARWIIAR